MPSPSLCLSYLTAFPLLDFFFLVPPLAAGSPPSTRPSCRSGVTATCGRWVRFPSIGVWTAWTRQGCWPRLNSARETKATWEPWAPSARLVAPQRASVPLCHRHVLHPLYIRTMSNKVVQGGGNPIWASLRLELTGLELAKCELQEKPQLVQKLKKKRSDDCGKSRLIKEEGMDFILYLNVLLLLWHTLWSNMTNVSSCLASVC